MAFEEEKKLETGENDATEEVAEAPATEEVTEAPTTEEVAEAPTTEEVTEAPATEEVVETPATEEVVETPAPIKEEKKEKPKKEKKEKRAKGKKKKSKEKIKFTKKDLPNLIFYGVVMLLCLSFLLASGTFAGIFQAVGLLAKAPSQLESVMDSIREFDQNFLGGALNDALGGKLGNYEEQKTPTRVDDPEKAQKFATMLHDAFSNRKDTLDVAHLQLTVAEVEAEMEHFLLSNPEYFYVSNSYEVACKEGSNLVEALRVVYLYGAASTATMTARLESKVQQIVENAPNGTEFDTVLYFHDYLVRNYSYDYRNVPETQRIRDAYRFFEEGSGVCQAYMQAMTLLCHAKGIESIPVLSDEMDHAWNLVKVEGEWYHVDVTWDDAGGQNNAVYPSYSSYRYFMLSDAGLRSIGRTAAYETEHRADDARYDAAIWRGLRTPMVMFEGTYYAAYFDEEVATCLIAGTPEDMQIVTTLTDARWRTGDPDRNLYLRSCYMSLVVLDGGIYLNTATEIMMYDPTTGQLSSAMDLHNSLGERQIFGIASLEGNCFTLVLAKEYQGDYTLYSVTLY